METPAQTATVSRKDYERVLRGFARSRGYRIVKSRARVSGRNLGEYRLIDRAHDVVILGADFDATLPEIHAFIEGEGGRS